MPSLLIEKLISLAGLSLTFLKPQLDETGRHSLSLGFYDLDKQQIAVTKDSCDYEYILCHEYGHHLICVSLGWQQYLKQYRNRLKKKKISDNQINQACLLFEEELAWNLGKKFCSDYCKRNYDYTKSVYLATYKSNNQQLQIYGNI